MKEVTKGIKYIVCFLSFAFAVIVAYGQFTENVVLDNKERLYFLTTNYIVFGVLTVIAFIILGCLWHFADRVECSPRLVFVLVLLITGIWVLSAQVLPESDASYCLKIAAELYDNIYYSLEPGQYLDVYRINALYCLYLLALTAIGGANNVIFVQLVNSVIFAYTISAIYGLLLGENRKVANMFAAFIVIYCPMWLQVTFCYSNVLGICLGLNALVAFMRYITDESKKDALLAAILLALSCQIKGIVYLLLASLVVVVLYKAFHDEKKTQAIVGAAIIIISLLLMSIISNITIIGLKHLSNGRLSDNGGSPTIACVVMGLDILPDDTTGRSSFGWYSGFNANNYIQSGCDYNTAKVKANLALKEKIGNISEQPSEYFAYLQKKNNSIWNEPTFGTFYRNNVEFGSSLHRVGVLYDSIINETGVFHKWIIRMLRVLQFLIYVGVAIYSFFSALNKEIEKNMGLIAFIGAFIFFSFWEAKSEYVICFFILLIPYGVMGLGQLTDLFKRTSNIKSGIHTKKTLLFLVVVVLLCSILHQTGISFNDDDLYQECVDDHTYLRQGQYDIVSKKNNSIMLSNVYYDFDLKDFSSTIVDNTDRKYNKFLYWNSIDLSQLPKLSVSGDHEVAMISENDLNDTDLSRWRIIKRDGGYVIKSWTDQNKVLTLDEATDSVCLADYEKDNMNQVWLFE